MPFRHGAVDIVQSSAIPSPANPTRPLQKSNPKGLQDEMIRHLIDDGEMSSFDLAVQFLNADTMSYWDKHQYANFWIENASVKWNETEAPFHRVARLTLLSQSQLTPEAAEAIYFDVTKHSTPDSPEASIVPAASGKPPAEKRACARRAVDR